MFLRRTVLSQPFVRCNRASSAAAPAVVSPMITQESTVALKPSQVVVKLDDHIVGQADAKRAVAIALRNRWRRHMLSEEFKSEVVPKNILMIGPTGCGKTEIARRLSILSQAPFVKVEATKFTEVGFHGKDVDTIIKDLVDSSIKLVKKRQAALHRDEARKIAERTVLQLLGADQPQADGSDTEAAPGADNWLEALQNGHLDDKEVEVEVTPPTEGKGENQTAQMMLSMMNGARMEGATKKKMSIKAALPLLEEQELAKLVDQGDVTKQAITEAENNGIVFIDEIDKIASSKGWGGSTSADASSEGVQRDLLPLIEGCTVNTKHGNVVTDHILFIASGAFHTCKPSDLLAELQGRLPIRVELKGLTQDDMYRILTEPVANLIRQQVELLRTEGVELAFEDEALREIARAAVAANKAAEDIGARRLHAVLERIMEEISFEAAAQPAGTKVVIGKAEVEDRLKELLVPADLSRHIL